MASVITMTEETQVDHQKNILKDLQEITSLILDSFWLSNIFNFLSQAQILFLKLGLLLRDRYRKFPVSTMKLICFSLYVCVLCGGLSLSLADFLKGEDFYNITLFYISLLCFSTLFCKIFAFFCLLLTASFSLLVQLFP